nr:EOG090X02MW [Eubosmina coregoni]
MYVVCSSGFLRFPAPFYNHSSLDRFNTYWRLSCGCKSQSHALLAKVKYLTSKLKKNVWSKNIFFGISGFLEGRARPGETLLYTNLFFAVLLPEANNTIGFNFIPFLFLSKGLQLELPKSDIQDTFVRMAQPAAAALYIHHESSCFSVVLQSSLFILFSYSSKIIFRQGKLTGFGMEDQLPTVAIVSHYDSFGAAPDLSFGGDSNASGVATILELIRLFSRLTSQPGQNGLPRFNLVFILTGGGKLNFLGSKKILEDQLDTVDGGLFQDTVFALCLDSLGSGSELNVHVSKPPKDGSSSSVFVQNLQEVAANLSPNVEVNTMHKKINLADDFLAWEHERYSIRRLTAMTLSHYKNARSDFQRGTILDTKSSVDIKVLARNVRILAETLAMQLYNTSGPFFVGDLAVSEKMLDVWMNQMTSQPRSSSSVGSKSGSGMLVNMLQQTMQRYLNEVKVTHLTVDKRDPEFGFYDQTKGVLTAYSVKPAVFDLFLTATIAAYLTAVYFGVQTFQWLYAIVVVNQQSPKSKAS